MTPSHKAARPGMLQLVTSHPATVHALFDKPQIIGSAEWSGLSELFRRLRHVVARWWLREVWHWTR